MKQRILYFVPDCPVAGAAGNITRFKQMLYYLNQANQKTIVDFVSLADWGDWDFNTIEKFKVIYPNINLLLLNRKINKKHFFKLLFFYKIPNAFHKLLRGTGVDISSLYLKKQFTKLINKNKYDKIIISYALWGNLVKNIDYKSYLILDTHDFITAQNREKKHKIGRYFQSEMDIINLYDEVWTFSVEEKYIFEQFSDRKIVHLPIAFTHQPLLDKEKYKYDVLYVASENPHNIKAVHWFLTEVLPLLNKECKIHIVGKICKHIGDYDNVVKHGLVEDILDFYRDAKIAICPMLSGTGVKIKVLEALSYNIPVVTNTRGIDGLVNKSENGCIVADTPDGFANMMEKLILDRDFYQKYKHQAHAFFKKNHHIEREKEFFKSMLYSE